MKKYLGLSLMLMTGLLVSCAGEGYFGPQGRGGWRSMMHYGFGNGGMFMWIIFLIVIGLLIYYVVEAQKTKGQTPTQNENPLDILRRRYAKGEIAREEYERMKKDLEG
ncbi:MAG: SHOCT domain-containing protein [Syntrophales bacterium]|nr:SHOCT domain-containing protein [Syntrophales bacterium]MDP3096627.1 SHOCT domain-containing protein [Syntrophales bacterium]